MTRRIRRPLPHSRINQSRTRKLVFDAKLALALFLVCLIVVYRSLSQALRQKVQHPPVPQKHHTSLAPFLNRQLSVDEAFLQTLKSLQTPFHFFEKILPTVGARPLHSDVVELRHCHLALVDYNNYTTWAIATLNDARPNFEKKLKAMSTEVMGLSSDTWKEFMVPEFALGLLEIYATHKGFCNFAAYPLQIADDLSTAEQVLTTVPANVNLPRFAIVIVAFKDAAHLEKLVKAVHLPHHYIIIHLERLTSPSYATQVRRIASQYRNVAVVQFGTVTYRTDSVSMINYQIMNWLVNTLKLSYDYHFTLGGAVYPLYSAKELAQHLKAVKRDVWLGAILHNGKALVGDGMGQWDYLVRKRLIFTSGERKYQQRTKTTNQNGFVVTIPDFIKTNMTKKTNSGNQGVFSHKFVKELTNSAQVKELFSIAKYGCCCCLEERTWIAAARIIGYKKQALEAASMFQVWGGDSSCKSSMNNAVLSVNASLCFKTEDASENSKFSKESHAEGVPFYLYGNEMLAALKDAKNRGFMFARKFDSEDPSSVELLGIIQSELHQN